MHEHDVIVVGAGGGTPGGDRGTGSGADVAIVRKLHPVRSHTGAAEGGINAALRDADSWEDHAYDTMKGSDYPVTRRRSRPSVGRVRKRSSGSNTGECPSPARTTDASPSDRSAGFLPRPRTPARRPATRCSHDVRAGGQTRITVYDEWHVMELAVTDEDDPADRTCHGVVAYDIQSGEISGFSAKNGVILATGGMGQVFDHTTNAVANTGDGVAMAYRAGVPDGRHGVHPVPSDDAPVDGRPHLRGCPR